MLEVLETGRILGDQLSNWLNVLALAAPAVGAVLIKFDLAKFSPGKLKNIRYGDQLNDYFPHEEVVVVAEGLVLTPSSGTSTVQFKPVEQGGVSGTVKVWDYSSSQSATAAIGRGKSVFLDHHLDKEELIPGITVIYLDPYKSEEIEELVSL